MKRLVKDNPKGNNPKGKDSADVEISNEWSNNYVLNFNPEFEYKINVKNVKYVDSPSRPSQSLVETDKYCHLIENKNLIDEFGKRGKKFLWSKWSKIINPYEKIGSFSNLDTDLSISRAFYKLYEVLFFFEFQNKKIKNSLHICEAPGGFISASLFIFPKLNWFAQTLYEGGGSLNINEGLDPERWVRNGDGDLYKLENIKELESKVGKVELITGDGGFDVSHDPNNQEQLTLKLIYSQVLTALHCQSEGGSFICKIFDSMTRPTFQVLLILKQFYEYVHIIKPRTSRYANSEKYIVAQGFKTIEIKELDILDSILNNWGNNFCRDLGIESKNIKFKKFKIYNTFLVVNQAWYIYQAIQYAKNNNKTISNKLETMQNKRALVFCLAFNLRQDENMCEHKTTNKIVPLCGDPNIKFLFKCQDCLQLMVKV